MKLGEISQELRAGSAGLAQDWDEFTRWENDLKEPVIGIYFETEF